MQPRWQSSRRNKGAARDRREEQVIVPAAPESPPGPRPWWETRWFVGAMILLSAVPLLYPPIPPLVDLMGHMARYRVELDLGHSPELQRFYGYNWALIGNLGVDLLIWPLGKLLGLELATKLIVISIPVMTVAGFLWVAREVHHRLPPTVAFALPFAYGHHFLFGFVNYSLAMALAFLAFGLWLRLGRLGKLKLRAMLFVPISIVVWVAHTFGWGMLGLLCFSAEAVRQHDAGRTWWKAALGAAMQALVLAFPLLLMIAWRENSGGFTGDWFSWKTKWMWLKSALRDRWYVYDLVSVGAAAAIFLFALVHRQLTISRMLSFTALVLLAAFIILPRIIFGSAYADMRLMPFLLAVALLGIRFKAETQLPLARVLAVLAVSFMLVRTATVTASLAMATNDHQAKLPALQHVPLGARVATFVGAHCGWRWALPRNDHLGAMVTVRRLGFSNNQWLIDGANLLEVRNPAAGRFAFDPSQRIRPARCSNRENWSIDRSLTLLPRQAFDYVWLVDPPPFDRDLLSDAHLVWQNGNSSLYRLSRAHDNESP